MIRRIAAVIAATAMLLVLAVPAMAGGWAEINADAQTAKPPTEGTPIEIGFTVLQHGETPAPWETATVHFTDAGTGEAFDVVATNDREDGHFVATATMPHAGYWSWQVTLKDLESQHVPVHMTVLTAGGALPPFDPSTALAAIDRAKAEVKAELTETFYQDIARIDQQADQFRARIAWLGSEANLLREERNEMAAQLAESRSSLPIVGVISLSVLAGAAAGFAMSWLAGRPGRPARKVALNPATRGADPV